MGRSHGRLHRTQIHRYRRVIVVIVTVAVEISMYYGLRVLIVLLGILLRHLHPFPASYLSVVVSNQVIVLCTTQFHKTIVERDYLRFGKVFRCVRWQRCSIESIQFLVVLESMF